jgi:hypothetical protein
MGDSPVILPKIPDPGNPGSGGRRPGLRKSMLKGAKLLFNESVVDCLVLNISETGARVRTAAVVPIPDRIRLRLNDGATFSAAVRWTRGMEFGVAFDGPASLPEESARLAWHV